jgi:hypothetical protein
LDALAPGAFGELKSGLLGLAAWCWFKTDALNGF